MLLVKHKVDLIQFTAKHSLGNKTNRNHGGDIPTLFPWAHSGDIPLLTSPCLQWVTLECSQSCRGSCPALPTHLTLSLSWQHPCITNTPKSQHFIQEEMDNTAICTILCVAQLTGAGDSVGAWRTVGITRIRIWIWNLTPFGKHRQLPRTVFPCSNTGSLQQCYTTIQLQLGATFYCLNHRTSEQHKKDARGRRICIFEPIWELITVL